jgi:hypothetical protein
MATLYGKTYTRDELSRKTGDLWQLGGVKPMVLDEGPERGVRVAEFRTGGGLNFAVLLDRGMDIGWAEYRGAPLAWQSAAGPAAPAFLEPQGLGWLRGFHGGLVATCGLTYAGAPCTDEGQELGLDGRISYTPARHVYCDGEWQGDEYLLWTQGEMREAVIFGGNIALRRRIWSRLGEKRLFIDDVVTNEGYHTTPHMILYHINIGFPVVDATTELVTSPALVRPRDGVAVQGIDQYERFQEPTPEYAEQVIASYDPQQHHSLAFVYGHDPGVASLAVVICALWLLGYPEEALRRSEEMLALARELDQPFALSVIALAYTGRLHRWRHEVQAVQGIAEAVSQLGTEKGIAMSQAEGTMGSAWVLSEQGHFTEGIEHSRQGLAA